MPQTVTMNKRVISKLYEVDPTFREVVSALYGDAVDPRELWDLSKSMPGQSDLHVNGRSKNEKKKAAIAGGLVFGTAAEGAAVARAGQHTFPKAGKAIARGLAPVGEKIPKVHLPNVAGLNGKGEFALQAANMGVGLLAARELFKKPEKGQNAQKTVVGKNDVFHSLQDALPVGRVVRSAAKTRKAANQARVTQSNIRAAKVGRRGILVAASAGSAAAGYKAGKGKRLKVKVPPQASTTVKGVKVTANVSKNTEEVELTWSGEISKFDTDKRQVFGWCSLSQIDGKDVVDLQGDYVPIEEIEKSAYHYVINSRKGGDMHKRVGAGLSKADEPLHTSDLIESFVVTPEKLQQMGLSKAAAAGVPIGWWVGFKVNDDEQWAKVKSGERTGFSIHGSGSRVEKAL